MRRAAARRRRANPLSLMPRRLVVALVSMLLCELRSVDVEAQSAGEPPLAASVPQAAPPAPAQPPAAKVAPKAAPPKAAPVAAKPADPNLQLYTSLIRSTLVAFNQANMTGQYNVLYALAAPEFQAQNSAAKLEQSFAPFKNQKIDLTPVTVLSPQLVNLCRCGLISPSSRSMAAGALRDWPWLRRPRSRLSRKQSRQRLQPALEGAGCLRRPRFRRLPTGERSSAPAGQDTSFVQSILLRGVRRIDSGRLRRGASGR